MSRAGDWQIKKWMDSDIKAARLFNCICNVSAEDAKAYAGISATRLKTWDNMHLIEERVDRYGNRYYRTTPKGRREFEKRSGIKGYWSNSYVHDKGLYDVYVERSESEQRS